VIEKMEAIRRSENKRVCFIFILEIEGCDCFAAKLQMNRKLLLQRMV